MSMQISKIFDLRTQFVKYGEYHYNLTNVIIHIIFVPTILWTFSNYITLYTGGSLAFEYPESVKAALGTSLGITASGLRHVDIYGFVYMLYYFILDPIAALLFLPIFSSILGASFKFVAYYASEPSTAMYYTTIVFFVSWAVQFIGHFTFEKRAPALFDNLLQAFAMAPFFVFLEILFTLGYRKEFCEEMNNEIIQKIKEFKQTGSDGTAKSKNE
ncbi:putative endoplasmic reticulum membrane protein [Zancudomyces culisetae]|uniref:Putative endoplasmic reticulum membrane protein n=1 Tax=Zancudomyces culisetae TaxID=1213189 RepID=A0A1R1PGE8_ZANCU|nr:putative endoplasmic reticulum membrane protein [Zancudomyces culisetae]OMH80051.1 putative endoplasmic reticulum membrane protein [Zancudomyces culisetae]|eukprot:OMH79444.1 putative endoplasmic reticulum membrane protein [Zancudomyces culisetae]